MSKNRAFGSSGFSGLICLNTVFHRDNSSLIIMRVIAREISDLNHIVLRRRAVFLSAVLFSEGFSGIPGILKADL